MQIRVKLNNLRFFRFVVVVFLFTINSLLMLTWDVCTIWMSAKRRYKRYRVGKHANQLTLTSTHKVQIWSWWWWWKGIFIKSEHCRFRYRNRDEDPQFQSELNSAQMNLYELFMVWSRQSAYDTQPRTVKVQRF